jgi:hypothetical protein
MVRHEHDLFQDVEARLCRCLDEHAQGEHVVNLCVRHRYARQIVEFVHMQIAHAREGEEPHQPVLRLEL